MDFSSERQRETLFVRGRVLLQKMCKGRCGTRGLCAFISAFQDGLKPAHVAANRSPLYLATRGAITRV